MLLYLEKIEYRTSGWQPFDTLEGSIKPATNISNTDPIDPGWLLGELRMPTITNDQ